MRAKSKTRPETLRELAQSSPVYDVVLNSVPDETCRSCQRSSGCPACMGKAAEDILCQIDASVLTVKPAGFTFLIVA